MSRPMILGYNLPEARLAKLRFLCMKLGLLVKSVPQEDFSQPIGALCGVSERIDSPEAAALDGEMIVFCHMTSAMLDRFLQTARQLRLPPFPIKAMLTPTNAAWNAPRLYAELTQERNALRSGTAAHTPD
ncbi:MAG: DUF3783 domain-containing protein [Aristaeellaceae bacterium]